MYFLNLRFVVRRPVFSLPEWHGARWSAWFREASHQCSIKLEDMLMGLLPMRNGTKPLMRGEHLFVRAILAENALALLPNFLNALAQTGGKGEFSASSLELVEVTDLLGNENIWSPQENACARPRPFEERFLAGEIAAMLELDEWSIQFTGPLRLPLPPGHENRGASMDKYAAPEDFCKLSDLLALLNRIRFLGLEKLAGPIPPFTLDLSRTNLRWQDMRYNAQRKIALGGITGQIYCRGKSNHEIARRFVLGQYMGAGKNARFGLGFWNIPELSH